MKLAEAQAEFLRAADGIPSDKFSWKTSAKQWSAAEIVAHVMMVERAVVRSAQKIIERPRKDARFWERAHLPLWLVETRVIRVKTPLALDPGMIADKEEMLGELRATRGCTLEFLAETQNRDLSVYGWPHVFLGRLNLYEWFEMIAAHQLRHTKQIREVAAGLPKVVESSQNQ